MAAIFSSVLNASIWGGCFTVLFMLINKLFKNKLPVSWHYYIWLVVIVRLLVPAFMAISVERMEPARMNHIAASQIEAIANAAQAIDHFEEMEITQAGSTQPDTQIIPLSAKNTGINVEPWMIWIVTAAILLAAKFMSYVTYIQKLKNNCSDPSEDEQRLFLMLKKSLNIKRNVIWLKCKSVQTPFAIGVFNVMVILPDKEYSDTQLNYMFQHELTHIKYHDLSIKWLYEIAKAVHWFNPFVYIAARNASFYCEAACDAAVLRNSTLTERKEYSMMILNLIEPAVNSKTSMCVSMYSSKANLKKRIGYILNSGQAKKSMGLAFAVVLIILSLCACSSLRLQETPFTESLVKPETTEDAKIEATAETTSDVISETNTRGSKANILIAGVDDKAGSGSADTIIVASFDAITNQLSLLSVPRDTHLIPSEETITELKKHGVEMPSETKFGAVTAYAQSDGMEYLQKEIGNALGIPIDYYLKMDMSAFKKIVDSVGGVNMTIPKGGLHYSDPFQELEISLEEGQQLLDGEKALMLIRYRSTYTNGDLGRVSVQQQFLQEIYSKLFNGDKLIEKATALLYVLIENTETNVTVKDFTPYLQYIPKLNTSVQMFQLPVRTERINERFYAIIDNTEFESSIADVFR